MRKLLLLLILAVALPAFPQSTTTVSGTLLPPVPRVAQVKIEVQHCGNNVPRVLGTGVIVQPYLLNVDSTTGVFSGTVYKNNQIDCGGTQPTWYLVTYLVKNVPSGPSKPYIINGNTNLNSAAVCTTCNSATIAPVVPNPEYIQKNPTASQSIGQAAGTDFAVTVSGVGKARINGFDITPDASGYFPSARIDPASLSSADFMVRWPGPITVNWSAPGTIGAVTPNTGKFTTLEATTLSSPNSRVTTTNGAVQFWSGASFDTYLSRAGISTLAIGSAPNVSDGSLVLSGLTASRINGLAMADQTTPDFTLAANEHEAAIDVRTNRLAPYFGQITFHPEARDNGGYYASEVGILGKQNPGLVLHTLSDGTATGYPIANHMTSVVGRDSGGNAIYQQTTDYTAKGKNDWFLALYPGGTYRDALTAIIDSGNYIRWDVSRDLLSQFTGNISDATNASPIVLTLTAPNWLYAIRSPVVVAGVTGNTAANGQWYAYSTDSTHIVLVGTTGNGAYAGGGTVVGFHNSGVGVLTIPAGNGGAPSIYAEGDMRSEGLATFNDGVQPAATGTAITWYQVAQHASLNLASVAAGAISAIQTETITGAALGDVCHVVSGIAMEDGGELICNVTGANTIKWYLKNNSVGAIDRASDTYTIRVQR